EIHGLRIRLHYPGRDCGHHLGLHRTEGELDRRAQDRDLILHLGHLPDHGVPARHRRMARTESGHDGRHCGCLFRGHLGRPRRCGGAAAATMKLLVTGVSHKPAPSEARECLAFPEPKLADALKRLKSYEGVAEAMILSTCNRVEITVTADDRFEPQSLVDAFL